MQTSYQYISSLDDVSAASGRFNALHIHKNLTEGLMLVDVTNNFITGHHHK